MQSCPKCNTRIINDSCSCGIWCDKKNEKVKQFEIYKKCMEVYKDHIDKQILPPVFMCSLDDEGIQALFFKGNYTELQEIKKFAVFLLKNETEIEQA